MMCAPIGEIMMWLVPTPQGKKTNRLEPLINHDVDTKTNNKHLPESWNLADDDMNREVVLSASKIKITKTQQQTTSLLPETQSMIYHPNTLTPMDPFVVLYMFFTGRGTHRASGSYILLQGMHTLYQHIIMESPLLVFISSHSEFCHLPPQAKYDQCITFHTIFTQVT